MDAGRHQRRHTDMMSGRRSMTLRSPKGATMYLEQTAKRQPADQHHDRQHAGSGEPHGAVVLYPCKDNGNRRGHERMTHMEVARKLAAIKGFEFAGEFDSAGRYDCPLYYVPSDTLVPIALAHGLGIHAENDLFGGVVPYPFVATKTITHPLPAPDSEAPAGWSHEFTGRAHDAVLKGFSAFTLDDARSAGMRLLELGAVRVKKPSGIGGLGQTVVTDAAQLDAQLASFTEDDLSREGLVVEQNLSDVVTQSVGQVQVGGMRVTYYGTQRLTVSNHGVEVYGGSDLVLVRGDFDALLLLPLEPEVRTAVAQARTYHAAAMASFPGMFASRCNYDIAQGSDDEGRWHSGVLEQSWRIGGASGAEVAALEAFHKDPALQCVSASTTEIYGDYPALPADAVLYFQGIDEHVGAITKYSCLKSYGNP
jgi:hypothetical protein